MRNEHANPVFRGILNAISPDVRDCDCEGVEHETDCREHPDYDPTPWCNGCGARKRSDCHCGPLAEND